MNLSPKLSCDQHEAGSVADALEGKEVTEAKPKQSLRIKLIFFKSRELL